MSSYYSLDSVCSADQIARYESAGLIRRTFRRLDPQRQTAVLKAILDEAAEKGPSALNIKEVARRADLSVGSLYQYFGSRQGLLDFAVALVVENVLALFELSAPYLEEMPLAEAVPAYVMGAQEWSVEQRGAFLFFMHAAYQGDPQFQETVVRPVAQAMLVLTRRIVLAAVRRGEVRSDIDIEATVRAMNTLFVALGDSLYFPQLNTYYQAVDPAVSMNRILSAVVDLLRGRPS